MNKDKMKLIEDYFGPKYDSDEDLPEEYQKKIKDARNPFDAEKTREEGWEQAGMYPKLKRALKGAYYGDKRNSKK